MKASRQWIDVDVDVEELDRLIDGAKQAPLSEADCQKLKAALHALVERLRRKRSSEKTRTVLELKTPPDAETAPPEPEQSAPAGPQPAATRPLLSPVRTKFP
jgi:hypothetical protein